MKRLGLSMTMSVRAGAFEAIIDAGFTAF